MEITVLPIHLEIEILSGVSDACGHVIQARSISIKPKKLAMYNCYNQGFDCYDCNHARDPLLYPVTSDWTKTRVWHDLLDSDWLFINVEKSTLQP